MSVSVTIRVLHEPLVRLRTASAIVSKNAAKWMFGHKNRRWYSRERALQRRSNELVPSVNFRTTSHFIDLAWVLRGRIRKLTRRGDQSAFLKEPLFYQNVFAYLGTSLWSSSLLFELLVSMAVIDVGIGLCWCKYFHFFVPLFTFRFLDFHFRFAFSYMGNDILRGPPFITLGIQLLDRCRVDLPFFSSQGFFALGSSVWREHC